jgi:hypothetical protein
MIKKVWRKITVEKFIAVSIILILLSLGIYANLEANRRAKPKHYGCDLCSAIVPTPFTNPFDNQTNSTTNGGGWAVRIMSLWKSPKWESVTVMTTKDGLPVSKMVSVKPVAGSTLWQTNGTHIPKWWAQDGGTKPLMISPNEGVKIVPNPGPSGKGVNLTDLQTMEGASFIVVDVDGTNSMSSGDLVLVFANSNGDTKATIGGTGYQLEFAIGGTTITSTSLA